VFVKFIASTTGTLNLVTYSVDGIESAQRGTTKKITKKITRQRTKVKALLFGSLGSNSFKRGIRAPIWPGGDLVVAVCSLDANNGVRLYGDVV